MYLARQDVEMLSGNFKYIYLYFPLQRPCCPSPSQNVLSPGTTSYQLYRFWKKNHREQSCYCLQHPKKRMNKAWTPMIKTRNGHQASPPLTGTSAKKIGWIIPLSPDTLILCFRPSSTLTCHFRRRDLVQLEIKLHLRAWDLYFFIILYT